MKHYRFQLNGVLSFCWGQKNLADVLELGATDVMDLGTVYVFRDRHGFPTWVSSGMTPGMWGDLSEEAFEEVMSH